jgi:hypothetical protein
MSTNNTYLALFLGSKTGAQRAARHQEGMPAWGAWMAKHQAAVPDDCVEIMPVLSAPRP